jgi:regulator of replication initiation timing
MKVLLYFVLLYFGSSTVLCQSRDELVERLLQETMELKKETTELRKETTELKKENMELRKENIKVWEKIKQLEVGKDMTQHKSKRCKCINSFPQLYMYNYCIKMFRLRFRCSCCFICIFFSVGFDDPSAQKQSRLFRQSYETHAQCWKLSSHYFRQRVYQ